MLLKAYLKSTTHIFIVKFTVLMWFWKLFGIKLKSKKKFKD